jgi:histidine ammonia-lyase
MFLSSFSLISTGTATAFHPKIHEVRPHNGQQVLELANSTKVGKFADTV